MEKQSCREVVAGGKVVPKSMRAAWTGEKVVRKPEATRLARTPDLRVERTAVWRRPDEWPPGLRARWRDGPGAGRRQHRAMDLWRTCRGVGHAELRAGYNRTHAHTRSHARTHTLTRTHMHRHTCIRMHARTHTHMHAHTRSHPHRVRRAHEKPLTPALGRRMAQVWPSCS